MIDFFQKHNQYLTQVSKKAKGFGAKSKPIVSSDTSLDISIEVIINFILFFAEELPLPDRWETASCC